ALITSFWIAPCSSAVQLLPIRIQKPSVASIRKRRCSVPNANTTGASSPLTPLS
ncbi:hypothetical protein M9458_054623, partial [Cirrhinus mrigala]